MPDDKETIFNSPPSEPDDKFWLEQGEVLIKGSVTAILDAAKSLITGISIKLAAVAGNIIMDDAKMGGITPAVLIFSGRCVL